MLHRVVAFLNVNSGTNFYLYSYPHPHVYEEVLAKCFSNLLIRPLCIEYYSFITGNCKYILFQQRQMSDFVAHFLLFICSRNSFQNPEGPGSSNIDNAMTSLQLDLDNQKAITELKLRQPDLLNSHMSND